ncbi:MAG: tetratricopeptide repeat protein [Myxococcaceae bacterium]
MGLFSKADPIDKLKQELERKPKDSKLLLEVAGLLKAKGAVSESVKHYLLAAQAMVDVGFTNKGVAIAKQVIGFAPKLTEPHEFLAKCYEQLKLKEDLRGVLKNLATLHASEGNNAEAARLRKKIEELGPGR